MSHPQSAVQKSSLAHETVGPTSNGLDIEHLQQAFQQFNRLSENFVHSYQNLEDQVESLADKLAKEASKKEQQLHEKERVASRLQSLLSILPAGVVVLDDRGCVQECNKVAVDLLGRPLLGEKWISIIQRCFAPRVDDGHEISLKDGRRVHIETRSLDYEPGQLIVLTDLTETRKLQDKVSQQKRLSSMGKMMASLAHQIRTPLSSALIYADSLSNLNISHEKQQKFSKKLVGCLSHLERHINDMLRFARSGGIPMESKSVKHVTSDLSRHVKEHYPDIAVEVNLSHDFEISINQDSLFSAILNLVDNAYEATEAIDNPTVSLSIYSNTNEWCVAVKDNGSGIDELHLDKVLDPFYTTKSGGTGLGLAVVHGAVNAHKGSLDVASKKGEGCTMTITLNRLAEEL
ncbi:sensor histidine kinase [Pleionea sediminis]|uniref:sensor histidine kinase n=1 Tax=Pleionea sediminis TaxID=2569479 RepID=UPI001185FC73|nr:ATP-binding protein [Pleionea sediminis]